MWKNLQQRAERHCFLKTERVQFCVCVCVVCQESGLTVSQVLRTIGCRIQRLLTSYWGLVLAVAYCTGSVQVLYGRESVWVSEQSSITNSFNSFLWLCMCAHIILHVYFRTDNRIGFELLCASDTSCHQAGLASLLANSSFNLTSFFVSLTLHQLCSESLARLIPWLWN